MNLQGRGSDNADCIQLAQDTAQSRALFETEPSGAKNCGEILDQLRD
jgi:hypothetical protein